MTSPHKILPFGCSLREAGGNSGRRDQIRPALPGVTYMGDGRHNSRKLGSRSDLPTETGLGRRETALRTEKGRSRGPLSPPSGRADMSQGGLASRAVKRASVGLRVASGAGTTAGRVLGTDRDPWRGQTDHAHGHQKMESSGSARTWQKMAGTD